MDYREGNTMNSKRGLWIAEGILGVIGVAALFMGYDQITTACVVAIAATMDKLSD